MSDPAPPPGSNEALAAGCTCPVMDNARGGHVTAYGCPLHWPAEPKDEGHTMPDPTPTARPATDEEVTRLRGEVDFWERVEKDAYDAISRLADLAGKPATKSNYDVLRGACHPGMLLDDVTKVVKARLEAALAERDAALAREAKLAEAARAYLFADGDEFRRFEDLRFAMSLRDDARRAEEGA
jgi:hypothetical protein